MCKRKSTAKKDLHYTVMAPTAFEGEPEICLVIVKGKEPKTDVEIGIDIFVDEVGSIEEEDYFEKNFGEGKRFPGGPTCTYKGKKFHAWLDGIKEEE